jgi:hypothetical protein
VAGRQGSGFARFAAAFLGRWKLLGGVAYTPQAPQETRTAGPPSRIWTVQNGDIVAPGGAVAAHQAMQGGLDVPASGLGCPVPMQGSSAVQLHGLPMHAVVEASCGMHTLGSTGEGVVVKSFGHPTEAPDELPDPPELLELSGPGVGDVCPPQATRTASTDEPTNAFLMSASLLEQSGRGWRAPVVRLKMAPMVHVE